MKELVREKSGVVKGKTDKKMEESHMSDKSVVKPRLKIRLPEDIVINDKDGNPVAILEANEVIHVFEASSGAVGVPKKGVVSVGSVGRPVAIPATLNGIKKGPSPTVAKGRPVPVPGTLSGAKKMKEEESDEIGDSIPSFELEDDDLTSEESDAIEGDELEGAEGESEGEKSEDEGAEGEGEEGEGEGSEDGSSEHEGAETEGEEAAEEAAGDSENEGAEGEGEGKEEGEGEGEDGDVLDFGDLEGDESSESEEVSDEEKAATRESIRKALLKKLYKI